MLRFNFFRFQLQQSEKLCRAEKDSQPSVSGFSKSSLQLSFLLSSTLGLSFRRVEHLFSTDAIRDDKQLK
jgi:hypothetical protein